MRRQYQENYWLRSAGTIADTTKAENIRHKEVVLALIRSLTQIQKTRIFLINMDADTGTIKALLSKTEYEQYLAAVSDQLPAFSASNWVFECTIVGFEAEMLKAVQDFLSGSHLQADDVTAGINAFTEISRKTKRVYISFEKDPSSGIHYIIVQASW